MNHKEFISIPCILFFHLEKRDVKTRVSGFRQHISIMHICGANGTTVPPSMYSVEKQPLKIYYTGPLQVRIKHEKKTKKLQKTMSFTHSFTF